MALINLTSSVNDQIDKQNQLIDDLKKQSNRFRYPPTGLPKVDKLSSLLEFSWKGIAFPVTDVTLNLTRQLVQHKYPNRDSARIEDLGRDPVVVQATGIFVNTIEPAPTESWKKGSLYPNVYASILEDALDITSGPKIGTLVHPLLGAFQARLMAIDSNITGTFRGGELVRFSWIETIDDNDINKTITNQLVGLIGTASQNAAALDNEITNLLNPDPKKLFPFLTPGKPGLADLMNSIKAAVDTTSLLVQNATATVGKMVYKVQQIGEACKLANNINTARIKNLSSVLYAQALDIARLASGNPTAQFDLAGQDIKTLPTTSYYIVPANTTLSALSSFLKNTVDELMSLNPNLIRKPQLLKGTAVKYYTK